MRSSYKWEILAGHSTVDLTYERLAGQQKLPMFGICTHTTTVSPVKQSSILSAKFDCPEARQNCLFFATAHDCETGL